eukprot:5842812-Karenia_brevis.AAC.1
MKHRGWQTTIDASPHSHCLKPFEHMSAIALHAIHVVLSQTRAWTAFDQVEARSLDLEQVSRGAGLEPQQVEACWSKTVVAGVIKMAGQQRGEASS